jgi:hypothetical protein
MAIGAARALMTLPLPDIKPLNCQSCLSFWLTLLMTLIIDVNLIGLAFVSYLLSDIISIYEHKG